MGSHIEHYAGGVWSTVTTNVSATLTAAACSGIGTCWAVGYTQGPNTNDNPAVVVEEASGGWSTIASPSASDHDVNKLQGVSCPSSHSCWAVGTAQVNANFLAAGETLIL